MSDAAGAPPGPALLFDGKTAAQQNVTVYIGADGVRFQCDIEPPGPPTFWPWQDLRVELEGEQLHGPDGAMLQLTTPALRAAVRQALPRKSTVATGAWVALAVVVLPLLGALVWGSDALTQHLATKVPWSIEKRWAEQVTGKLHTHYCETPEQAAILALLQDRLLTPSTPLRFDVHLVNTGAVNAYTLPGGVILIEHALLEQASRGEEVVGVLAHEMQHVLQRHVVAGLLRGVLLTGLWNIVLGDYTSVLVLDPQSLYKIATLQFSRDTEASADRGAGAMLVEANVDITALADFFAHLGRATDVPALLSSHPATAARQDALKQFETPHSLPVLSAEQWLVLRRGCPEGRKSLLD